MDIGTGIAIASVWLFSGMVIAAGGTNNNGSLLLILIAVSITIFLA